jgi:hypothetical protein
VVALWLVGVQTVAILVVSSPVLVLRMVVIARWRR